MTARKTHQSVARFQMPMYSHAIIFTVCPELDIIFVIIKLNMSQNMTLR